MNISTITRVEEIRLASKFLDANLKAHLLACLKRKENTCSKKYGYILRIIALNDILDSQINMADSTNCFTVQYTFETVKPEKRTVYAGVVVAIYSEGMIADINNLFQVLIVDGIYNAEHKTYTLTTTAATTGGCSGVENVFEDRTNHSQTYKTADKIFVKITDTTFRDGQFNCIGAPTTSI
jgi:DNA-directed RNA polymerase subunit E'/Rpb7